MSYPPNQPDPAVVAGLQKRFSGLDNNLTYQPGHRIHNAYTTYKAADASAGAASRAYKDEAQRQKASKPYDPNQKRGTVGGVTYYQAGHQVLAPRAGDASKKAGEHANKRAGFNSMYGDVLKAKGGNTYQTHVAAADAAKASSEKYDRLKKQHQKHS
ncbi:hypothetical protein QBC45DRAFT_396151 [Copromyces sp. CBS 386.78]|nr:hypothetical protein QBC45DRAFT_396151 [Copromyces sp. CBS 386.78]